MALLATLATKAAWNNVHAFSTARINDVSTPAPPNADFATCIEYDSRAGESVHCSACSRCELSADHDVVPNGVYLPDTEYFLDWWWRVGAGYPTSTNGWQIATQIHLTTDSVLGAATQPILVLALVNRSIVYRTSYGPASSNFDRVVGTFALNTWYRSTWRFKFARTAANGLFQAWLDGSEVIAEEQRQFLPADELSTERPYTKEGMYRDDSVAGDFKIYMYGKRVHSTNPLGAAPSGPTITAAPDATRFGKVTGTAWTGMSADSKRGSLYALAEAGDITKLVCWVDGGGAAASGSQPVRAVIYDSADALVAQSNEVTVAKGQAAGWVTFALPAAVRLAAGTYRLGLISGTTAQVARYAHGTTAGALSYGADAYADSAATGWGVTGADAKDMTIYAAYTPATTGGSGEPTTAGGMRVTAGSRGCVGSRLVAP